jgi:hypothetical protein
MASGPEVAVVLEWSGAEVHDATLVVAFAEEASKDWVTEVTSVLERLAPRLEVAVKRDAIEVSGVEPGAEGDVHHLLESAVLEANSRLAPEPEDESGDGDREGSDDDQAMTEAFRDYGTE